MIDYIEYNYNGRTYYFTMENDESNFLIIEQPLDTDSSISEVKRIRVYSHNDALLKVNNNSLSARGGAIGLYETIQEAADYNFLTEVINKIIQFAFR